LQARLTAGRHARPGFGGEAGKLTRRGCSKFSAGTLRLSSAPAVKPGSKTTGRPVRQEPGRADHYDPGQGIHADSHPECPVAGSSCGMGRWKL